MTRSHRTDTRRDLTAAPCAQRWADENSGMVQNYTVYEPESAQDTGLLDKDGNRIMKARQTVGFDLSGRRKA